MKYFYILPNVRVPTEWATGSTPLEFIRDAAIISVACGGEKEDVLTIMEINGTLTVLDRDEAGFIFKKVQI